MNDQVFDQDEIESITRELWDLKKLYDRNRKEGSKPLNFDKLLRDQVYRDKVLGKLSVAKNKDIKALATTVKTRALLGSVHFDDVKKSDAGPANSENTSAEANARIDEIVAKWQKKVEKLQKSQTKQAESNQKLKYALSAMAMLLVVSIAFHLVPLYQQYKGAKVVKVASAITENTTFFADKQYILEKPIFVESNAILTVEAGTTILGKSGSALIVTKDAKIIAKGTSDAPIVFTSINPMGKRKRGDWGGLVLLGDAPVNREGHIEGVDKADPRGKFGGKNAAANCGILEYVRVEFAGYEAFVDNELNGLTLGGCGRDTLIRNVQVHKSLDDGIEVFGGTVDLKNIVITGAGDDAFDWDMGWKGRVQFLVVQMHGDDGDNAFEGDNYKKDENILPRSEPQFYNVTLIGAPNQKAAHRAMNIRRGSGGHFVNVLISGFSKEAIDFRGQFVDKLTTEGGLEFKDILISDVGKGIYFSEESGTKDDDNGFVESAYFSKPEHRVRFGLDLRLPQGFYNTYQPEYVPLSHSPARQSDAVIPQQEFFDEGATFIGAVRPGTVTTWMALWTAFPSS